MIKLKSGHKLGLVQSVKVETEKNPDSCKLSVGRMGLKMNLIFFFLCKWINAETLQAIVVFKVINFLLSLMVIHTRMLN